MLNLESLEVARSVNTSNSYIEFVDIFSNYCYVVCYDYSNTIIRSFHTDHAGISLVKIQNYKITCIEHIDVRVIQGFSYAAGTENAVLL